MLLQLRYILLLVLLLCTLGACSNSDDEKEKGVIQQTTAGIAKEAVEMIKGPIEQAKLAKELSEQHNKIIEESVKD